MEALCLAPRANELQAYSGFLGAGLLVEGSLGPGLDEDLVPHRESKCVQAGTHELSLWCGWLLGIVLSLMTLTGQGQRA